MNRRSMLALLGSAAANAARAQGDTPRTRNLLIVTSDGLRWQEAFRGAEEALLTKKPGGVADVEATKKRFWRESKEARREALMPFLWSVVAKQGQLYGNRDLGSEANVTNGRNFSYPGYSEMMTGYGDPRIDSNDKNPNPNVNVLEWLNQTGELRGKVAAFGAWDVFPYILNASRSGMLVNAGYEPLRLPGANPRLELLNRLKVETGIWDSEALDAPMFHTALEYLRSVKPRVLYIALGDTDEWAHHGRYDLYLDAIRRADEYVKELWSIAQGMPEYQGSTSLLMTVDHGRGNGPEWTGHGAKIPESREVWFAAMGPDTKLLGERRNTEAITLSQVAATIAALMGRDYLAFQKAAAPPVKDALGRT